MITVSVRHHCNVKKFRPFTASILFWLSPLVCATQAHRIFPAANVESYGDSQVLGIVNPEDLKISSFGPDSIDEIIGPASKRFIESLSRTPDFAEEYEVNPSNLPLCNIEEVTIHVESASAKLIQGVPEDYDIEIHDDSPLIVVRASSVFGALRAFETLSQLLEFGWLTTAGNPVFKISGLPLFIADEPTYVYRGLMIDTSRHYLPLNLIMKNLDAMAMNKLNVLHWHLTDRESFPYESVTYPEISEKGAYHPRRIYTTKDIEIVIYEAYLRGIRVIPEVDMPGHTNVIAKSHPELMSDCPNPGEPLDPTNPAVYDFVKNIYSDLYNLFPDDFVHVGGDEVNFDCWSKSSRISNWMKDHNMTDTVELYEYFETHLLKIVEEVKKTPIVWQEVFNLNLTITPNTIVDVWKGFDQKTIEQATNQSYQVILSGCWYLDHLKDNWHDFYLCDPSNFTGNKDLMIGGHASMWGEHVDASNFISRTWPRASAAAERLWSGGIWSEAKDTITERIHNFRCHMVQQGFAAGPTGPGFCNHEVPYQHDDTQRLSRLSRYRKNSDKTALVSPA